MCRTRNTRKITSLCCQASRNRLHWSMKSQKIRRWSTDRTIKWASMFQTQFVWVAVKKWRVFAIASQVSRQPSCLEIIHEFVYVGSSIPQQRRRGLQTRHPEAGCGKLRRSSKRCRRRSAPWNIVITKKDGLGEEVDWTSGHRRNYSLPDHRFAT